MNIFLDKRISYSQAPQLENKETTQESSSLIEELQFNKVESNELGFTSLQQPELNYELEKVDSSLKLRSFRKKIFFLCDLTCKNY